MVGMELSTFGEAGAYCSSVVVVGCVGVDIDIKLESCAEENKIAFFSTCSKSISWKSKSWSIISSSVLVDTSFSSNIVHLFVDSCTKLFISVAAPSSSTQQQQQLIKVYVRVCDLAPVICMFRLGGGCIILSDEIDSLIV